MRTTLLVIIYIVSHQLMAQCNGKYIQVLSKDSAVIVPCNNFVWMNLNTYSSYYLAEKQLSELQRLVPKFKLKLDSINKLQQQNKLDSDSIIMDQHRQLNLQTMSTHECVEEVILLNKDVEKQRKLKNWFKQFAISEAGIILLILLL